LAITYLYQEIDNNKKPDWPV